MWARAGLGLSGDKRVLPGDRAGVQSSVASGTVWEGRLEQQQTGGAGAPAQREPPALPYPGKGNSCPHPGVGGGGTAVSPSVPSQAAQQKLRQASTNVKHWNVQMNRLMHPIGPGGRRAAATPLSSRSPFP